MNKTKSQETTLAEVVAALRESGGAVISSPESGLGDDSSPLAPVCALCRLVERTIDRSLKSFFSEFVNDPEVRVQFRKADGFCRTHLVNLERSGDALAIAILYADLTKESLVRWRTGKRTPKSKLRGSLFARSAACVCPACAAEAEGETRFVAALAAGLGRDSSVWEAVEASRGLCIRHVDSVAAAAAPADAAHLIEIEVRKLETLHAELEEIIRKNDYRYRGEEWGAERDAWRRALLRLRR